MLENLAKLYCFWVFYIENQVGFRAFYIEKQSCLFGKLFKLYKLNKIYNLVAYFGVK